jgi:hypothetical protein
MQITSTQRPKQALYRGARKASPPAPEATDQGAPPEESSRLSIAHRNGLAKAGQWSEKWGIAAGGVIGATLTLPAVYAGLMGGSVAGAVAGLSMGPAVGVLQGAQGFDLVGEVFSTGGTVGKAFLVAGAAAGLVGGWMAGRRVGEYVSAAPLSAVAYPVGFTQGLFSGQAPPKSEEPSKKAEVERIRQPRGLTKGAAGLLGGIGAISVGLGGAALGAGAAGGVSLIGGLLAGQVDLASLGSAALIGGGTGLALGGFVGGLGGSTIVTTTSELASWAKNKVSPDKEGEILEKLQTEVNQKQQSFEHLAGRLDRETDQASVDFARRQSELEEGQRETAEYVEGRDREVRDLRQQGADYEAAEKSKLVERQSKLEAADEDVEGRIEADAGQRFAQKRAVTDRKYEALHQELDQVRDAHQKRDDHITSIERTQAAEIEARVVEAYDRKMVPVNAHYQEIHAEQDQREVELQDWDNAVNRENRALDQKIIDDGLADFKRREPGLEREFEGKERELRKDYAGRTENADLDHQNRLTRADQKFRSDKISADRQHAENMEQADRQHRRAVETERTHHKEALSGEKSRHSRAMNDLERDFASKMDRLESNHRNRMAGLASRQTALESSKRDLKREKPQLESQLQAAQRDLTEARAALRDIEARWDREVGQAERERNAAVSERNSVSRELRNTNQGIKQAEGEKSKWVRLKAQVDALIPGLRSERDRLKKILDKMK